MKSFLKKLLANRGYALSKIPPAHAIQRLIEPGSYRRLHSLIQHYQINHVIDVGAFQGQFGHLLIHTFGFSGRITSFEPIAEYYQCLQQQSLPFRDRWNTFNLGIGDACGEASINIAGNAYSSSLLPMLAQHESASPNSAYIGQECIQMVTLDSMFDRCTKPFEKLYLKVDVQGFERQVLAGAQRSLSMINAVQLEVSLVELYQGEMLLSETLPYMQQLKYRPVMIIPGFANEETGELLQVDVVFHRHD